MEKITALVPIKSESERLVNKNFLSFTGQPLYQVILDKLQASEMIKNIVINTDSEIIADQCSKRYSKAIVIPRPEHIKGNAVTMNTIIDCDLGVIEGEHFLQTHCTNPLLTIKTMELAIKKYFEELGKHDSLFSVTKIKKRGFDHKGEPINHTNKVLLQTQHLPEIFIENSNMFIFSRTSFYNAEKSRIGLTPQTYPMNEIEGMDIDYEEDFILTELINRNKHLFRILD